MQRATATMPLGALAVCRAGASRVLRRHGFDCLSHGRRTLDAACEEAGLDPAAVLAEIEREGARHRVDWTLLGLPELVDALEREYHAAHRRDLPALVAQAEAVEQANAARRDCPRGLSRHLRVLSADLEQHMQKEEQVLFPMIRQGMGTHCAGPVRVMEQEHEDAERGLRRTRELTSDLVPPPDAHPEWRALYARLEAFEHALMEHAGIENHILFPRALASRA